MTRPIIRFYAGAFLLACAITPAVHADTFLKLDTGRAELTNERFDNAQFARLSAGYSFGPVRIMASAYEHDDFFLDQGNGDRFELKAWSAEAFWRVGLGPLDLDLGGGFYDWNGKTILEGRAFGRDSGTSTMLELGLSTNIVPFFGLYLNLTHVDDVTGEDLQSYSAGVQFSF